MSNLPPEEMRARIVPTTAEIQSLRAALTACEAERREAIDALREAGEIIAAAKPGLKGRPLDCTDHCGDDLCDCSGEWRTLSWDIDLGALRRAVRLGEQEQHG